MKLNIILLSLAFSTSVLASTKEYIVLDLTGAYNEQQVLTDLTKTIYVNEDYQSLCYQSVPGPMKESCSTVERSSCNDKRQRDRDPRALQQECRKEIVKTCERIPTTMEIPYTCTKTKTVAKEVADGQYLLKTSINIINPEKLDNSQCRFTGVVDQTNISNLSINCGDSVLEILSKKTRTISYREENLIIDAKIVSANELIGTLRSRLTDMTLIDNKFSFTSGKISNNSLKDFQFDLFIIQKRTLMFDKKISLDDIPLDAISIKQIGQKSRVTIDLNQLNVEIKKNGKYSIVPTLKVLLNKEYIGIDSRHASTSAVFTMGQ